MRALQSPADAGLNALLGPGSVVEGKLSFKGQVRIEGMFTGEITTTDLLVVGETAKVSANINCGSVVVNGEVIGNIKASDSIELHKPARDRKSTRLNSSHEWISYAVFCLKKKKKSNT